MQKVCSLVREGGCVFISVDKVSMGKVVVIVEEIGLLGIRIRGEVF